MTDLAGKITESELEVLKVLWNAGTELPLTEIRQRLEEVSNWDSSTIKTLLRRLCKKGVVQALKRDLYFYNPVISEAEYNEYATQALIDRIYSGSARNLVASLVDSKKLDKTDIEELRNLLKDGANDEPNP